MLPGVPPITAATIRDQIALIFPAERFNLDMAAELGKRNFEAVWRKNDAIDGPTRDSVLRNGANFIAPLEFLSEVFFEGAPLSKPVFEKQASVLPRDIKTLEVHCPRFGPVLLFDIPNRGRFISSNLSYPSEIADLLLGQSS